MEIRGELDKRSPIPLYRQIAARLRAHIRARAEAAPGGEDWALPTERQLSERFAVQRLTVRQALGELLAEDLLYRIRGKGTFVNVARLAVGQPRLELVSANGQLESSANPYSWHLFYDGLRGATAAADEAGWQGHLMNLPAGPVTPEIFARHFRPGGCRGVVFFGLRGHEAVIERLRADRFPYVVVDGAKKDVEHSRIYTDREKGLQLAVEHLLSLGHRRIALLNGPLTEWYFQERYNGYAQALRLAGVSLDPGLLAECGGQADHGEAAARQLLARRPDLTALVAATDLRAFGALRAAVEAGRRVPADLSVVGYHDCLAAAAQEPPLTTVRLPAYEMGRQTVGFLAGLADGEPPVGREVPAELVVRSSTADIGRSPSH